MMNKLTNLSVWQYGEELEHHPCDVGENGDCQSNGSIEHIINLAGKRYSVITDWYGNLRWPEKQAVKIPDED